MNGIPFGKRLNFKLEMISWLDGAVDSFSTIFWYGEIGARAIDANCLDEAKKELLVSPQDPARYKIKNSIEFEKLEIVNRSLSIQTERLAIYGFPDWKWSEAAQLICKGAW